MIRAGCASQAKPDLRDVYRPVFQGLQDPRLSGVSGHQCIALRKICLHILREQPFGFVLLPLRPFRSIEAFRPIAGFVAEVQFGQAGVVEHQFSLAFTGTRFSEFEFIGTIDKPAIQRAIRIAVVEIAYFRKNCGELVPDRFGGGMEFRMDVMSLPEVDIQMPEINGFRFLELFQGRPTLINQID